MDNQLAEGAEKLAVKMENVIYKMLSHRPESLLDCYIFLPTYLAKPALHNGVTIQTILLGPFLIMGHSA
jgi:hypothetical protein